MEVKLTVEYTVSGLSDEDIQAIYISLNYTINNASMKDSMDRIIRIRNELKPYA